MMAQSDRPAATIANVYRGTFMHSTQKTALEVLEDELLGVDTDGKIAFMGRGAELQTLSQTFGFNPSEVTQLAKDEFFIPGLVDTHIHACQYSYAGTALDMPLLQWLNTYTFPVESQFTDLNFAQRVYSQVVKRTLRNGTTTACYFTSIHTDASLLLGKLANDFGQRALVGKVCMDINDFVEHYKETTQESQDETCRFIKELLDKKYPLVRPVVTPRFALSCKETLLGELGAIAKKHNLPIQSHISENLEEVKLVKQLFPKYASYTDVYLKNNLLTDKTVMAHGCHLSDEELVIFKETGASLSHCPNSNISLCSGLLDVRNVLKHQVKLGLGTDVAGGYSASMLDAVRRARDTSKVLTIQNPNYNTLTFEEVFRLATLGGSQALSLDGQTGNFEVGKDFDALRVNVAAPGGPMDLSVNSEEPKIILEKFLNLGDDRNIAEVYVAGRKVSVGRTNPTSQPALSALHLLNCSSLPH
uniref:Guanine deaminase n=1 Tax=Gasterosteus aculeatus aculeatus TaxID=481459 RepID=G3P9D8_GASAC